MSTIEPLVVIGGGPAGVAAAIKAAELGLPSIVLDGSPGDHALFPRKRKSPEIARRIRRGTGVQVLSIFEGREILWSQGETSGTFRADQILLATGGADRLMPFPGWNLPGVISHDVHQSLHEQERLPRVKRAIVAGTGQRRYFAADRLLKAGVDVVAILDTGPEHARSESSPDLSKIPLLYHHAIFDVQGKERVQRVTFGKVDPTTWTPRFEEPTRTEDVDFVVVSFGKIARHELATLAGCRRRFNPATQSWIPIRDSLGRTSVAGIFALDQNGDEGSYELDVSEAQIAAITATEDAGLISASEAADRRAAAIERAAKIEIASQIQPGLLDLIKPDTLVCRCENIKMSAIQQALEDGACDLTSLKMKTRLGMGSCQGRDCAFAASMIICRATGKDLEEVGTINPRPPACPVTLGSLASMESGLPTLDGEDF